MRASRLVQLLLLLQTRGHTTATELAAELDVSVRTIYRDVDALSGAGFPVYSEPGRTGGMRLIDGYRTRLTGLTTGEAQAMLLTALPRAAADLGMGTVAATAQLKMLAALPPELRWHARRIADRVHVDTPGWFDRPDATPALAAVADALWHDRRLDIAYRRGEREVHRIIDPLGLVLKGGTWYLLARVDRSVRSYRVSRINTATPTGETFTRREGFDLPQQWARSRDDFARSMLRVRARCRVATTHLSWLRLMNEPAAVEEALATAGQPDAEGWVELSIRSESWEVLASALLPLGENAEVLEPAHLRKRLAATAAAMHARYRLPD